MGSVKSGIGEGGKMGRKGFGGGTGGGEHKIRGGRAIMGNDPKQILTLTQQYHKTFS